MTSPAFKEIKAKAMELTRWLREKFESKEGFEEIQGILLTEFDTKVEDIIPELSTDPVWIRKYLQGQEVGFSTREIALLYDDLSVIPSLGLGPKIDQLSVEETDELLTQQIGKSRAEINKM